MTPAERRVALAMVSVSDVIRGMAGADVLAVAEAVLAEVTAGKWPALQPAFRKVDPALAMEWVLECPSCGRDVEGELEVLDVAWRTTAGDVDVDRQVVAFDYDGSGEFDGVAYRHEGCGALVSLPDGWDEVTL